MSATRPADGPTYDEVAPLLPPFFEPMLVSQYGPETARRIVEGCGARRAVTLRANALKATRAEVASALDGAGIAWEGVSWYPDAFVLSEGARERDVWDLPLYGEGKVYLQSLSSMLPPLVLGPRPGADILDMAAAPGGKTTQMAALSGGRARITACEMHAPRAEKLAFNLERQGATCVNVMRADSRRLDDFFRFDQVLLDAPCSGSGTLDAYDPKLARRFTPQLVEKSKRAQAALLAKGLRLLKPGEHLVYSTCSVLSCENEDVVRAAVKGGPFEIDPIERIGDVPLAACGLPLLPTSLPGTVCVCPTGRYEGFFVARIRKVG